MRIVNLYAHLYYELEKAILLKTSAASYSRQVLAALNRSRIFPEKIVDVIDRIQHHFTHDKHPLYYPNGQIQFNREKMFTTKTIWSWVVLCFYHGKKIAALIIDKEIRIHLIIKNIHVLMYEKIDTDGVVAIDFKTCRQLEHSLV